MRSTYNRGSFIIRAKSIQKPSKEHDQEFIYSIAVVGDKQSGKTTLIQYLLNVRFKLINYLLFIVIEGIELKLFT